MNWKKSLARWDVKAWKFNYNQYNLHLKNLYEKVKKRNVKSCIGLNNEENRIGGHWEKKTVSNRQKFWIDKKIEILFEM